MRKNDEKIIKDIPKKYYKIKEYSDLKEMIFYCLEHFADRFAFMYKDEKKKICKKTYQNFAEDVIELGSYFLKNGFLGKKIAIIGKNSYFWAVSYFAASIVGVAVPLDKELKIDELLNFVNTSEASAILGDSKILKELYQHPNLYSEKILFSPFEKEFSLGENSILLEDLFQKGKLLLDEGYIDFKELEMKPDELHILLFTSGTTGKAKGVCLSFTNICSDIASVAKVVKVTTKTRILSILPLHHTYEATLGFLLVISSGGTVCYSEGLRYLLSNMKEFKPNFILTVPLLLENINKKIEQSLQKKLPKSWQKENTHMMDSIPFLFRCFIKKSVAKNFGGKLKTIIVGAAAISPDLIDSLSKYGFRILQGYGLTECSPLVAGNNDFYHTSHSVGLPIPNVTYKIHNPDQDGIGEILVKGPNVMLGYYQDQEETDKVLKDGWFHTGDLGHIDEYGLLYITGRCKTTIVTKNGKNIFPEELETLLLNDPLISEVLVSDDNDCVTAQIYPNFDAIKNIFSGKEINLKKIFSETVKKVNQLIPNYKHIKKFYIRKTEFEKTTTQKVKRFGKNLDIDKTAYLDDNVMKNAQQDEPKVSSKNKNVVVEKQNSNTNIDSNKLKSPSEIIEVVQEKQNTEETISSVNKDPNQSSENLKISKKNSLNDLNVFENCSPDKSNISKNNSPAKEKNTNHTSSHSSRRKKRRKKKGNHSL